MSDAIAEALVDLKLDPKLVKSMRLHVLMLNAERRKRGKDKITISHITEKLWNEYLENHGDRAWETYS